SIQAVERKRARLERWHRDPALRTGHSLGVQALFAIDYRNQHKPVGQLSRQMNRIFETLVNTGLYQQAIDDYFNRMVAALVELDLFVELSNLPVNPGAIKTRACKLLDLLFELALSAANDRSEDHHPLAFGKMCHLLDDLIDRLTGNGAAALRAVGLTDRRKKQTKIIVDFGDRSDRRSRTATGRLLFDGDRGGEAFDRIDIRLFKLVEELARIS